VSKGPGESYICIGDWNNGEFIPKEHIYYSYEVSKGMSMEYVREATDQEIMVIKLGYF
jgi:hypothetical protein